MRQSLSRAALGLLVLSFGVHGGQNLKPIRVWSDKELAEWATPVAGLNVRPGHFSEQEYYAAPPAEFYRTYPVYFPGREPKGYEEFLRSRKPEPLLLQKKRTKEEWIEAGKAVFRELDVAAVRSYDSALAEIVRSAEAFSKLGGKPLPDGTVAGLRWVPTDKGMALSIDECAGCHTRVLENGTRIDGAPISGSGNGVIGRLASQTILREFGDSPAEFNWRSSVVPWIPDDIHAGIRTMPPQDLRSLFQAVIPGVFVRFNGSPYYPTKVPDLIGIGERRFIDHTATHQLRNEGDLMRYAALVGCCDSADFGPHHVLTEKQRQVRLRFPDELLFALAQYIYSLQPPQNPNQNDPRIRVGKVVFDRENCAGCHTPPSYTNNKLTPAQGFTPQKDHPLLSSIMNVSVGTDPGLALKTRKGTGFYKVPSLKGLWYRERLSHDGSITSLEEWFDAGRLRDDFEPSGFKGVAGARAVRGHEFGLRLNAEDKAALIAFLRSL